MEVLWLLILLSLFLPAAIFFLLSPSKRRALPPGPPSFPLIGNLQWLRYSLTNIEPLLKQLRPRYGPIFALRLGSYLTIFISDRRVAHKALVEHGAAFADRPASGKVTRVLNSNQHNISFARYGPLWRLLRRNLAAEILHPAKIGLFAPGREWVLGVLFRDLRSKSEAAAGGAVVAMESFQFAMFCLLVLMCFGEKLEEKAIRDIQSAHRELLLYTSKLNVFIFFPVIAKHIFRNRWEMMMRLRQRQFDIFVPLIRTRKEHKENQRGSEDGARFVHSYVDSLLDINLPEDGGRKLTEEEMVTLCSEFFTAGTDTTATALQWIMAELVKRQEVQRRLLEEIESVAGEEIIKEEDLQRMPYLKALIMEGLRRHPPAHFVLPHSVTEEMELEGYVIPKNARINFMVAEMGWDEKLWEDPMEFRPERFMTGGEGEGVDITGSREIKMMPFGVGRRMCPGLGLAILHLEFFVANLVREFEWTTVEGEEVDFSEKPQFTVVMKNPLQARLLPRRKHP